VVERVGERDSEGTARSGAEVRWPRGGEARGDLVAVDVTHSDGERCLGRAGHTP